MGYAGYVPAKMPPSKPSDQEAAIQQVKNLDSLEIISKLLYNCAVQPKEEKFRKIRLTNNKIRASVVEVEGAVDALRAFGWTEDAEDQESLIIPAGVYMTMKDVRVIEDAKDRLKKAIKEQAKLKS